MSDCPAEEAAIFKLVARLAQASDDRDATAYRACLADAVRHGAPGEETLVAADDHVRDAMRRLRQTDWTHHRLVNPVIEVEPDGRRAVASIDIVVELCRADEWGRPFRGTLGGRYRLGFERSNGGWRIDRRELRQRYLYCVPFETPAAFSAAIVGR